MAKRKRTFRIDRQNSDNQYLHVHIDKLGTLIIKREDEGIVLDLYPYKRLDLEPVAGTWAMDSDITAPLEAEDDNAPSNNPTQHQGASA